MLSRVSVIYWNLPLGVFFEILFYWLIDLTCHQCPITWGTAVSFAGHVCLRLIFTLVSWYPIPQTAERTPRKFDIRSEDLRKIFHIKDARVSVKPISYMLVAKAMSLQPGVCSFCLEFTKGVVPVLLMSYFSLRGCCGGGGGSGLGIWRAYCSISKLLGQGWEGVMCGFAFNVLFTKVIVLFCIVV